MSAEKHNRSKKGIVTGLIIVIVGVLWLLGEMNLYIPRWLYEWYSWVIYVGIGIGVSSGFRKPSSWIPILVGTIFLVDDIFYIPFQFRDYFWPILVIIIGLLILIRPKKEKELGKGDWEGASSIDDSHFNRLDLVSIFNGIKKSIISKNFAGGETISVFGGTEIDLSQADFDRPIEIEAVVVFGGLKLIVPPTWEIRSNVTSILAGVEDKRMSAVQLIQDDKVLLLTGTVIFGGIDIVNP